LLALKEDKQQLSDANEIMLTFTRKYGLKNNKMLAYKSICCL